MSIDVRISEVKYTTRELWVLSVHVFHLSPSPGKVCNLSELLADAQMATVRLTASMGWLAACVMQLLKSVEYSQAAASFRILAGLPFAST